jgi:hypothetical protein
MQVFIHSSAELCSLLLRPFVHLARINFNVADKSFLCFVANQGAAAAQEDREPAKVSFGCSHCCGGANAMTKNVAATQTHRRPAL